MNMPTGKSTSKNTLLTIACAMVATLLIAASASAEEVGKISRGAGQSIAIDDKNVYWIDSGMLMRASIGGPPQLLVTRDVLRVSAGAGNYAYSTLRTRRLGRSQVLTRRIFRSVDGGTVKRLVTTAEYFRNGLYCGSGVGIWGIDPAGTLLYHTTTNKKKNKCFSSYSTQFYNVGSSGAKPTPVFKTGESLVGAQGTRVATKVKSGKSTKLRVTNFNDRTSAGKFVPGVPQTLDNLTPTFATFDSDGNAVVTTEGLLRKKLRRSGFIGSRPFEPTGAEWRYRACGRTVVRWLDEAITNGKRAALEVVANPLFPQTESSREIIQARSGSIRALTCDGKRVAYVLAASKSAKAAATVNVEKIDFTPPVVTITSPSAGANTAAASTLVSFTATDTVSPSAKLQCSLTLKNAAHGGGGLNISGFTSGSSVNLAMGQNSLVVSCLDEVGNVGSSSEVTITRGDPPVVVITSPGSNGANLTSPVNVQFTVNGSSTIPGGTACTVNGNSVANTTTSVPLTVGNSKQITVACTNPFGTGQAVRTVNIGLAPTVDITTTTTSTSDSEITIAYTSSGTPTVTCVVTNTSDGDATGNPVDLISGPNVIEVECTNAFGSATDSITITKT